jgi:two-component sensor histidine kinase/integral membrane sensor domain MASE1
MNRLKAVSASETSSAPSTAPAGPSRLATTAPIRAGTILLVLLIYAGASQLGFALHLQNDLVAFVRPAAGVLIGGLAVVAERDRPWLLGGAFLLAVAQTVANGHLPAAAMAAGLAQLAEGAIVIAFYTARGWPLQLGSPREVCRLLAAIVPACGVAGLVAALLLSSQGNGLSVLLRWFMADTISIIAIAPLFLTARLAEQHLRISGEAVLAIACGAGIAAIVFLTPPSAPTATQHLPVSLVFPFLLWCGARCSPLPNAILSFIIAMIAIASIASGLGPFSSLTWPVSRRLFAVQNFVLVVSAGTLLLSILFAERRDREAQLASALESQKALLYEVNHRVKNSLQLANSVLMIEASRLRDADARAALQAAQSRIAIIARLHRRLYSSERHGTVHLDEVLQETADSVLRSAGRDDISLLVSLEPRIAMDVGSAIPIALATAEIITNAVKHAYPARGGPIRMALRHDGAALLLQVSDEGSGFAEGDGDPGGIGMRIIRDLFRQLEAVLEIESTSAGTTYVVRIHRDQSAADEP